MNPKFCCGYECGVAGTVGQHWSLAGTGTSTFDATFFRSGLRSMRFNTTAQTAWGASSTAHSSTTRHIGRFYIYFSTIPSADTRIASFGDNDSTGPCIRFKQSDSKIYAAIGTTLGASGVAVTTGQWYLIDYDFNVNTGGSDACDGQVDGVALAQATGTGTSTGDTRDDIGIHDSCTSIVYYDDVICSDTAADYPIGAGKVLSFVPNADGTHTCTGTNIVHGTTGTPVGTGITSATTDVFGYLNARPIGGGATDATRLVNQQTVAATEYAEVDFEPTVEVNGPRAVEVLTADRQASTAAGLFQTKLNDNGTEIAVANRGNVAGVVTDRYVSGQNPTMAGGGAWTLARFNALKARFGYSSDATPDQYWRGIMIEAEFPESLGASAFGRPEGQTGQRQMNQLIVQ